MPAAAAEGGRGALDRCAREACARPGLLDRNEKLGGIPAIRSPAESEAFVREQYQLFERLALQLGMR